MVGEVSVAARGVKGSNIIMALHRRFQEWSTVYQGFSVVVTVCGRKNAKDGLTNSLNLG